MHTFLIVILTIEAIVFLLCFIGIAGDKIAQNKRDAIAEAEWQRRNRHTSLEA